MLSRNSERVRDFITTISILDRFSAPLCDAVADTTDSAEILDDLERRNLFLVPLDGDGRWFRFHHLFAAVARSELEARYADRVPQLHERAASGTRRTATSTRRSRTCAPPVSATRQPSWCRPTG